MAGFEPHAHPTDRQAGRGLWVVFLGLDGAGKSAVIESLAAALPEAFSGVEQFHFRPMFGRQVGDPQPVTQPHARSPRGLLLSILKLLYWLADYWCGYLIAIRPARAASRLVIFDRYLHDILIDLRRYRLPPSITSVAQVIISLAPQPDLFLLLDVPPHVVQQRKPEVTYDESVRQAQAYRDLFQFLPNSLVIDASLSLADVTQRVKSAILGFPTNRFSLDAKEPSIAGL